MTLGIKSDNPNASVHPLLSESQLSIPRHCPIEDTWSNDTNKSNYIQNIKWTKFQAFSNNLFDSLNTNTCRFALLLR